MARKIVVLTVTMEHQDKAIVDLLATNAMLHLQEWLDADPDFRATVPEVFMEVRNA